MLNEGAENMVVILLVVVLLVAIAVIIYNYYNLGSSKITTVGEDLNQELDLDKKDQIKTAKVERDIPDKVEIDKEIYLHIAGEVKEPGVYKCSFDARLYNLVEKAGGVTKNADLNSVNLVKPLQDGARVTIPSIEQTNKESNLKATQNFEVESKLNINQASKKELMSIKGIGDVTADNILLYRTEESGFNSLEELMKVSGIGERTYQQLKDEVTY